MIEIVSARIDVEGVAASVSSPSAGAVNVFIGTTRNTNRGRRVLRLRYEAYLPMALKEMKRIADEAQRIWPVEGLSIVHRIGEIDVGEASVVIAVSSPHRHESFDACRYAIDELKRRVPIWKQEVYENGEAWVEEPKPEGHDWTGKETEWKGRR